MIDQHNFSPPSQQTHFLVSGGGRGITAANAIALAEAFRSRFTLIGRSEILRTEPDWAVGNTGEPELKKAALEHYLGTGKKLTPKEVDRKVNRISLNCIRNNLKGISIKSGFINDYLMYTG